MSEKEHTVTYPDSGEKAEIGSLTDQLMEALGVDPEWYLVNSIKFKSDRIVVKYETKGGIDVKHEVMWR